MWRDVAPASFQKTVSAATRSSYVGRQMEKPWRILDIRPAFAINTQRNLRLSFWVTDQSSIPDGDANGGRPTGVNLMAFEGDSEDYIVGDGEEGEKSIAVQRQFPEGLRPCVEAYNVDGSNAHTLDVIISLQEWIEA